MASGRRGIFSRLIPRRISPISFRTTKMTKRAKGEREREEEKQEEEEEEENNVNFH